jgi:hypothetical protein
VGGEKQADEGGPAAGEAEAAGGSGMIGTLYHRRSTMLVHSVYFWLKPDLTAQQLRQFEADLRALAGVESLRFFSVGKPADTDRPIIDRTYSFALTTAFDDMAGHDVYQVHPLHKQFLRNVDAWQKVVIYDSI